MANKHGMANVKTIPVNVPSKNIGICMYSVATRKKTVRYKLLTIKCPNSFESLPSPINKKIEKSMWLMPIKKAM